MFLFLQQWSLKNQLKGVSKAAVPKNIHIFRSYSKFVYRKSCFLIMDVASFCLKANKMPISTIK